MFREGGTWYCFTEDGGTHIPEAAPSLRKFWYGTKTGAGVLLVAGSLVYLVALRSR